MPLRVTVSVEVNAALIARAAPFKVTGPLTVKAWLIVKACVFNGLPNTKLLIVWPLAFKPNWLLLSDALNEPVPSTPCTLTAPVVPTANVGVPSRRFK